MRRQREEYERQKLLKGRQSSTIEHKHHSPKIDPSLFKSNKNIHFKSFDPKTDEDLIEFIQIVDENDLRKFDLDDISNTTKQTITTPTKMNKKQIQSKTKRKRPLNSTAIDSFLNNSPTSSQTSSTNLSVYDDLDSDYANESSANTPFNNLSNNKNQQNNRKRSNLINNRSYHTNNNKRKRLN